MVLGTHENESWAQMDGSGHYWSAPPPGFYATPTDPLVSPTYEGWWRRSIALAKKVWKPALVLHAILVVPTLALSVPASENLTAESERLQDSMVNNSTGFPPMTGYFQAFAVLMGVLMISGLMSAIATAISVQLVVLAATGQPISLRTAVGAGLRRAHAVIGWGILGGLLIFGSVLLCFLPIVYVTAVLLVLPVVVTIERGRGIGRCFEIFHASFGTSVARVATVAGITLGLSVVLTAVGLGFEVGIGGTAGAVASAVANAVHYLFAGVALPPLLVTAYADMRSRREPFSTAYLSPAAKPTAGPPGPLVS